MTSDVPEIRTYSGDERLVRERRRHIAACAVSLFARRGFKGTTMRELARACGMAQGAIYHYIGTKDDILRIIVGNAAAGGPLLREFVSRQRAKGSITESLVAAVREYYRWADKDQENYIFFNREMLNFSREDRSGLLRSQIEIIAVFEGLLREGTAACEFKADYPVVMAHNIVIQGYDWAMRRWYLKERVNHQEYTDIEIELLLRQLGAPKLETTQAVTEAGARVLASPSGGGGHGAGA